MVIERIRFYIAVADAEPFREAPGVRTKSICDP
jgi:hypothetical protein